MYFRFTDNVQNIVVDHKLYDVHFMDAEVDDDYKILRYNTYEQVRPLKII